MKTNEDAFENDDDIDEMEEDSSIDDEAAELDKWEDEDSVEKADILEKLSRPVTFDPAYQPFGDGHSAEKIVSEIRKFLQ